MRSRRSKNAGVHGCPQLLSTSAHMYIEIPPRQIMEGCKQHIKDDTSKRPSICPQSLCFVQHTLSCSTIFTLTSSVPLSMPIYIHLFPPIIIIILTPHLSTLDNIPQTPLLVPPHHILLHPTHPPKQARPQHAPQRREHLPRIHRHAQHPQGTHKLDELVHLVEVVLRLDQVLGSGAEGGGGDGDEAEDGDEADMGGEEGREEPDAEELPDGDVEGEVGGVVGCGDELTGYFFSFFLFIYLSLPGSSDKRTREDEDKKLYLNLKTETCTYQPPQPQSRSSGSGSCTSGRCTR